jgi:hypothetical protein
MRIRENTEAVGSHRRRFSISPDERAGPERHAAGDLKEAAMVKAHVSTKTRVGDVVVIEGHKVGEGRRIGEILEVLGEPDHEHYRVRWEDDHVSVFYPSSDAIVQHATPKKGDAAERRSR